MEDSLILGIDVGTTKIKVVVYDIQGRQIGFHEEKNIVNETDDNFVEQDMNLLWYNITKLIQIILKENNILSEKIKGIGVTGQGEGLWMIDKTGKPINNAILWSDGRANKVVEAIENNKQLLELYRHTTGSHPFSGAQLVILKWLAENRPELFNRIYKILFCKDWIRYKLTGVLALEYTDASTSVLNIKTKEVAKDLFEHLGLNEINKLFPQIKKSGEVVGTITKEAAKLTGLKAGTPVVAGLMDIAATALGVGAVKENDCCTILGTTCCNEILTKNFNPEEESVAGYEISALNDMYLKVMATMAGTPNLDWFINEFFADIADKAQNKKVDIYQILERELKKINPGSDGIIYHPYISNSGERAPFLDSNAKAQFFGLSSKTTRYHLLRAVYEGVAYSIRDCLKDNPEVSRIYLTGGGARSTLWGRIIADVTGKKVILVEDPNPASKGVAILAGLAVGIYKNIDSALSNVMGKRKKITPDKKIHELYSKLFELYVDIRKHNKDLWERRKKIIDGR